MFGHRKNEEITIEEIIVKPSEVEKITSKLNVEKAFYQIVRVGVPGNMFKIRIMKPAWQNDGNE